MKGAIYIENGLTQLVLTPESDFEKNVSVYTGGFYHCQGGWVRQREPFQGYGSSADESLIMVMEIKAEQDD